MDLISNESRMNIVKKILEISKTIKKDKANYIENIIFEKSKGSYYTYNNIMYEIIYKIHSQESSISDIIDELINNIFLLNERQFEKYKKLQKEKDDFLDKPIDVDESIVECGKCKSKKTYSYSKQVRSSDEGFSVFSFCFNCQNRWRIN
jgi:DNA-directed RNA polymerase subunit M/transcription elongation factor TFIIS